MRWPLFFGVTIAVWLILRSEWKRMKHRPGRDKAVFLCLNAAIWLLFLLDLPHTPGPTSLLKLVFKPFAGWTKP